MTPQSHSWVHIQRNWNQDLKEVFAHHAECSISHNGQDREKPKCPTADEWIKKMRDIHTHTGILLSYKQETLLFVTMDESGGHYAKWGKSKKNTAWYHLFVESKKEKKNKAHFIETENGGYQGLKRGRKWVISVKGYKFSFYSYFSASAVDFSLLCYSLKQNACPVSLWIY